MERNTNLFRGINNRVGPLIIVSYFIVSIIKPSKKTDMKGTVTSSDEIPTCIRFRYVEKNVRFSSLYRKYKQNIPQFLVNRPRHLVLHCMERWEVAKNIPKSHITVIDDVTGEFKVKSQLDPFSVPQCECPAIFLPGNGTACQPITENHHYCSWITMLWRENHMQQLHRPMTKTMKM